MKCVCYVCVVCVVMHLGLHGVVLFRVSVCMCVCVCVCVCVCDLKTYFCVTLVSMFGDKVGCLREIR